MAENLQDWIGRTTTLTETADGVRAARLATLLGRDSDAEGPLSPLGHWLHFSEDDVPMSDLGADGHAALGGFMPPVPLPRRMWAGSTLDFHTPIRPGQTIERTTTIESIAEKVGSTGPLCFVVLRHEVSADGTLATTDRQTIVYREATATAEGSSARPPRDDSPAPEGWDWVESVRPNEVMLFRYSALTFNSHRIHYDYPYVTEVEGYPGLVTHGPLTATLLLDRYMTTYPETSVSGYRFTAKSPLFAGEQIHLAGRETEPGVHELQAIAPDGKVAIAATVTTN
ncbi:FAS1-like dehydratase domain-containing protein [Brevibacterium gallinarum]|uniref:MaoC family dehydratase N-terminal domain-containing protein n=1 Tax=Brevibacterium gallinarum TaxID=2762220 RepID=A0ABR8WXG4_9MICO|nr:MaoC family dehydratase N-terminal domain-containing protein [Brevibacterium gallinarum]MBD8021637.1 MaoC family dehydratase N-terminal domain-containing protein [Brevibacterium gallinarum]